MFKIEEYCNVVDGALVLRKSIQTYLRQNILTCDPTILHQLDMLDRVGNANIPLTILGESGCGKDSIAQYAHDVSSRRNKPFLKINCRYLPEEQVITELFGSAKSGPGLLQRAQGGSLYIENINLLSCQTQYRFMEHIHETEGKQSDIRYIIYPSDLNTKDQKLSLIEPLVYYFNAAPFVLPPLRERPADILLLTMQQTRYIYDQYGVERNVGPNVMKAILEYDWPGNIRQLIKVLERMAFMSDTTLMDSVSLLHRCLTANKQFQKMQTTDDALPKSKTLKELLAEYEIKIINQYVMQHGTLRKAAAALGVSHSLLSYKLKKHYEETANDPFAKFYEEK